jgi:hypothetical protein
MRGKYNPNTEIQKKRKKFLSLFCWRFECAPKKGQIAYILNHQAIWSLAFREKRYALFLLF